MKFFTMNSNLKYIFLRRGGVTKNTNLRKKNFFFFFFFFWGGGGGGGGRKGARVSDFY